MDIRLIRSSDPSSRMGVRPNKRGTDARWALGNSRRATCLPEGKDARGSASGHQSPGALRVVSGG